MPIKDVGQRIAKLRKENGYSQMELAEKLNVSDKTVSKWENGGMPGIDLLPGLSSLFGVSIDYLLTGFDKNASTVTSEQEREEEASSVREPAQAKSDEPAKSTTINNESAFDRLDRTNRLTKRFPENYVCPKCKRVNAHPDEQCKYCYHTFSWDEYVEYANPVTPGTEDYVCPKCQRVNHKPGTHCQYCYCDFTKAAQTARGTATEQPSYFRTARPATYHSYRAQAEPVGCLGYFIGFVFPLIGLIWGFKRDDKGLKIFSGVIFALNFIIRLSALLALM